MKTVTIPEPAITICPCSTGQNISVSADAIQTLKAIGKAFGVYFEDHRDTRVMTAELDGKQVLILQEDISRHGSPCWHDIKTITDDPERIAAYNEFDALLKRLRRLGTES